MLSTKRNHASILADTTTDPSSTTDNDKSAAKLTHTLSKSLKEVLLPNETSNNTTNNEKDVYHQYLNSPPPNTTNDNNNEQNKKLLELQTWLTNAMTSVGVGSNFNTIKFWKEHINNGNSSGDNLTELYADSRYLVWFVKEILLPVSAANNDGNEGDIEKDTTTDSNTEQLLEIISEWHISIHQLLSLNSAKASEDEDEFNTNGEEEEEEDMTAGVMWQMLVQSSNLTPEGIRETLDGYMSPQTYYEKSINSGDGDVALPGEYFAWPSFFQHVTSQAQAANISQQQSSNKRRRSNTSKSLSINASNNSKNENWYPLLGYAITYAFYHVIMV